MRNHFSRPLLAAFALGTALTAAGQARASDPTAWIDALDLRPGVPLFRLPPAAGAVIAVDERRATDRYVQTITLRGDPGTVGENQIVVTVTRDGLAPRISDETLSAEAADRLPPMTMALGPADLRDEMGGFGAAVGARGALACAYGWQTADLADRWIGGGQPSIFQERHALSLRMRLCRTDVDAAGLATLMEGLRSTAGGSGGGEPVVAGLRFGATPDAMSAALDLHRLSPAAVELPPEPTAYDRPFPGARAASDNSPVRRARPRPVRVRAAALRRRGPALPSAALPPHEPVTMAGMPQVPLPQ